MPIRKGTKPKRTCEDCFFAVIADYGYSNYTTEGTEFYCTKLKHPKVHFDRFYGKEVELDYAMKCRSFAAGGAITMDVDGELEVDLTHFRRIIWNKHVSYVADDTYKKERSKRGLK